MDLPPLTYLSFDSAVTGVGASQVTPYLRRLSARGLRVTLHSYEKGVPPPERQEVFAEAGIDWRPHRFQSLGSAGGALRSGQAAMLLRGAELVHARSDLAAASAMVSRRRHWVWDVRSFWIDERIAMGFVRPGSMQDQAMRLIERQAARRSGSIVTLTTAAIPELQRRHGASVGDKVTVISTCVDLARFAVTPLPDREPLRVLMSGSFNPLYDLESSIQLVRCLRERRRTELTVLTPNPSMQRALFDSVGATFGNVPFSEMPARVAEHHVGFGIWKPEAGVGLLGAAPIKLAEFLASGRPVVVNAGLGDMERLVTTYDCGVVLSGSSPAELQRAASEIERLVDDPGVSERCRRLAEQHFDVEEAVDKLLAVYRRAAA